VLMGLPPGFYTHLIHILSQLGSSQVSPALPIPRDETGAIQSYSKKHLSDRPRHPSIPFPPSGGKGTPPPSRAGQFLSSSPRRRAASPAEIDDREARRAEEAQRQQRGADAGVDEQRGDAAVVGSREVEQAVVVIGAEGR